MPAYVAVHGGAGVHSRKHEKEIKKALRDACTNALSAVRLTPTMTTGLAMVETAICALEDDPCLNAGYGSNLTLNGTVECDAAIMSGSSKDFGSIGAVAGVKNPIRLASLVLEHSRRPDRLGRLPPLTLASEGARAFAASHPDRVTLVTPESLITPGAQGNWKKWKERLDAPSPAVGEVTRTNGIKHVQDTVGAVVCADDGLAAGVSRYGILYFLVVGSYRISSGGILLKYPGRVGEAAVYGAGCWAEQKSTKIGMACSVSGAGEHVVRAMLARRTSEALVAAAAEGADVDPHEILRHALVEDFWKPANERGEPDPWAGVLLLITEENEEGGVSARLWCAFTSPSMAIAYASLECPKPKALILRRPEANSATAASSKEPQVFITALSL
ncbi:asparaginase [Crucibulum laeve]|uniref:Asparaginase n=1 Tax=Crucibulum laeve TaxID=68775 RepID=A0A5C3MGM4_9AGAR|nr:asparaginase [Crucibulum laeve]